MGNKLYRSRRSKVFGGVCGGFAEYYHIDVSLLRILLVFADIFTGIFPGLFIYVLCVIIIPIEPYGSYNNMHNQYNKKENKPAVDNSKNKLFIGVGLIIFGGLLLCRICFDWIDFKYIIPICLILLGGAIVYKGKGGDDNEE